MTSMHDSTFYGMNLHCLFLPL